MRRTTVRIDEELLAEAKALAAQQHRSLNSVMEDALRQLLKRNQMATRRSPIDLPVSGAEGLQPRWDPGMDIKQIAHEVEAEDFLEGRKRDATR